MRAAGMGYGDTHGTPCAMTPMMMDKGDEQLTQGRFVLQARAWRRVGRAGSGGAETRWELQRCSRGSV